MKTQMKFITLPAVLAISLLTGCQQAASAPTPSPVETVADAPTADTVLTWEELQSRFALTPDTAGKSGDELLAEGQRYEHGDGVVTWNSMAEAYYQAAAQAGSSEAEAALSSLHEYRDGIMANSPDGQGEIFDFFRSGVEAGQKGDDEQAYASAYDDVFFFGDPAYRGLGTIADQLAAGKGVDQDVDLAVAIYTFNAKTLGKGNGFTSLGLLSQADAGTYPGIEHSDDAALENFELSYQAPDLKERDFKGPRYAGDLYDSGYTHDDGSAAAPDYVKAEQAYLSAAEGNGRTFDGTACFKLGTYYEQGREGIAQDYAKAATYYEKAVSDKNVHGTMLGIPQTYLALGRFYEEGLGVAQNADQAIAYYQQARDAAQENLDLPESAGYAAAQAVKDEAEAALARLGA